MLSPTRLIFTTSGYHRIHFSQHSLMNALGHYSNIQCFFGNQAVSSCNRISWRLFFKVTNCRRFTLSVTYPERTTLWNFNGRIPFIVAVLFCEGAFVPILHITSLCPRTKKQMLHVWFVKRQFPGNVNINEPSVVLHNSRCRCCARIILISISPVFKCLFKSKLYCFHPFFLSFPMWASLSLNFIIWLYGYIVILFVREMRWPLMRNVVASTSIDSMKLSILLMS